MQNSLELTLTDELGEKVVELRKVEEKDPDEKFENHSTPYNFYNVLSFFLQSHTATHSS